MLGSFRKSRNSVLIWALMALLAVGLVGLYGNVGRGLTSSNVARVGDRQIPADDYARAVDQEIRALPRQPGRQLTMADARQYGIDRMVLARMVNDAALDAEAARLGVSTGDDTVRRQVMATPAFQGSDGTFDREAYTYALDQAGMRTAEFEELLRRESARELVAGAVQSSAVLPESATLTVLDFLGEKRSFDWLRLDAGMLPAPVPAPTDADLEAQHKAHEDRYTRPETRTITYASVTPEALAATIEIPEEALRAAYDAGGDRFRTPERRVLDRVGFGTSEEAAAAKARLDAGEITFDGLAAERGLTPQEIQQGFVAADALSAAARDAVFGAAGPGIVGPVDTPLGPSIYRINAVLGATTTSFEDARAELQQEQALEQAKKQIADDTAHIEDLLAGGATAEEIASETVMELGTIELNDETHGGVADDPAFRDLAAKAREGEETDLAELAGGGLATLRVDKIAPPAVIPLADIRDRVAADWTSERTADALTELADGYVAELKGGLGFAALAERLGRPAQAAGPLTRGETVEGAPPELVADIFAAGPGGTVVRRGGDGVILAQLTAVEPFDPAADGNRAIVDNLRGEFRSQAADDVLTLYTAALRDRDGVSVNQPLIDSTLSRFQ